MTLLLLLSKSALLMQDIEAILAERLKKIRIVGHCFTIGDGLEALLHLKPDFVLLDMDMPKARSVHWLRLLGMGDHRLVALCSEDKGRKAAKKIGARIVTKPPLNADELVRVLQ